MKTSDVSCSLCSACESQSWYKHLKGQNATGDGKVWCKRCYDRESRKKSCGRPKEGRRDDKAGEMGGG